MTLNRKYKIHTGLEEKGDIKDIEEDFSNPNDNAHKFFIIKGAHDFSDINLRENGWKRTNTPTFEQEMLLKNTPGYLDYKETLLYKGLQGIATLDVNKKKKENKLNIYLNNYSKNSSDIFKGLISMFENAWDCKLENPEEDKEKSKLIKKIGSN